MCVCVPGIEDETVWAECSVHQVTGVHPSDHLHQPQGKVSHQGLVIRVRSDLLKQVSEQEYLTVQIHHHYH